MVFAPISRYSLVNAKIRSRLGALLTPEHINRLAEARDLTEFYSALNGTPYQQLLMKPEISFDPRVGEKFLMEQEAEWHLELLKDLKGIEKELVSHFLEKYEIENLKVALRIREGKRGAEDMKYLIQKALPHSLDYQAISEAGSMEEAISHLQGSPFMRAVEKVYGDYEEKKTLFPIEINLEMDYYDRLKRLIDGLSMMDRNVARKLVGLEIDQKNLGWLVRLKFYYNVPAGDLMDYYIPGGFGMKEDRLRKAFMADSIREVLSVALERSGKNVSNIFAGDDQTIGRLYLLEIILWNHLITEARKALGGFPFTIGTVLSYLILKRTEIRNLITIMNGKIYKMDRAEIESHLRVSF